MPPWCEVALVAFTPIVVFVVVVVIGRVVATNDAHAEDGRVGSETLHRLRKDDGAA